MAGWRQWRSVTTMSTIGQPTRAARTRVAVADLEGQPAADAAIALRRAGLRPALERTFHWGEDTHGLVVSQEPAAGSEVPLDSTVLLFVSAPGERGETRAATTEPPPTDAVADAAPPAAQDPPGDVPVVAVGRRRRKAGLSLTGACLGSGSSTTLSSPPPANRELEPASPPKARDGVAEGDQAADDDRLVAQAESCLARGSLTDRRFAAVRGWSLSTLLGSTVVFVAMFALVLVVGHALALQAAGAFNGTPISGVQTFVDKLRGNLVWLGGTAMGLVIAVVGIMFMAGHSRAHDLAIRTIVGPGDPGVDQRHRRLRVCRAAARVPGFAFASRHRRSGRRRVLHHARWRARPRVPQARNGRDDPAPGRAAGPGRVGSRGAAAGRDGVPRRDAAPGHARRRARCATGSSASRAALTRRSRSRGACG